MSDQPMLFAQPEDRAADALIDPVKRFPAPPFERQQQPWPGLARDMNPPARPRRRQLCRVGAAGGAQGADHRR